MTEHKPRVDVVIPTHNRWPMVADAIRSVLSQSYPNTGCIVVDDGSSDSTAENISRVFGQSVQLLVNPRSMEKSYSRNRGVRESRAEFVCFLDSDDVLLPRAVEERVAVFLSQPEFNGVVYGYTVAEDQGREAVSGPSEAHRRSLDDYLADKAGLRTNSYLLRRQVMLDLGMYNEQLSNREDIELFIRLLCRLDFICCASLVSHYRKTAADRARDNWQKIIEQGTSLTDSLARDAGVVASLGEKYQALRSEEYQELLRAQFRRKDYAAYQHYYERASREKGVRLPFKYRRRQLVAQIMSVFKQLQ